MTPEPQYFIGVALVTPGYVTSRCTVQGQGVRGHSYNVQYKARGRGHSYNAQYKARGRGHSYNAQYKARG